MQLGLVALLQAQLADVGAAGIVGGPLGPRQHVVVGVGDAPDVADDVCRRGAQRVMTMRARLDLQTIEAEAHRGQAGSLLVGQAGLERNGAVGVLVAGGQPLEAAYLQRADRDDLRELLHQPVHVARLAGGDFQGRRVHILGQHDAVAVQDAAPLRRQRQHGDAVVLGQRVVLVVAGHLQIPGLGGQQPEACQAACHGNQQPAIEAGRTGGLGRTTHGHDALRSVAVVVWRVMPVGRSPARRVLRLGLG